MRISNPLKRTFALLTLAAFTATSSFAAVFDTSSGTDWFDGNNYGPVGVPTAATNVDIFSTAAVAAEIHAAGALANNVTLGASNWPGSLVVGASGTLDVTNLLTLESAANGNQTSSLTNHGVITLGGSFKSSGINTIDNNGTLTAKGMTLGSDVNSQTSLTNAGTIDLGSSGRLHLCSRSTEATEFTMLAGTVIAKSLNLHSGRKANLNLYGGTIRVNAMTDASADFLIDVKGAGELILKGNVVSQLDGWIAAGHIFTSASSGSLLAVYDSDSKKTRLYADASAPSPDPAGFAAAPMALDTSSVRMLAMPGNDESGVVEYLFTETSGNLGGSSSGWQSSPYYEDAGLTAGLQYSYTVTMRDLVGNVGTASAVSTVTVQATTAGAATQSGGWNDPATWGGSLPALESDVTIPMGVTVTLVGDQECGSLTVMGKLIADPDADCSLRSDWLMVMGTGAEFEVGTHAARYPHKFTLTLKGLASEANPGGMGSKFLGAMNGGTIHLHGPERVSWTKLGATAVAGATTLTLDDPVDWLPGEEIVITSTDLNWNHAEERVIASVSGDGMTVTLTLPLKYAHTGVTETHTRPTDNKSWSIELKAEVGLLSRDVKVQGDIFSVIDGFGGHTMVMGSESMDPGALYVEGVELYRMGQTGVMGRYPVHWHLLTDQAQGQYVRNSSIHHSFSRAVTIHGTDYITVEDNFCYDHLGHGIFLENGAERFNEIRNNVVLLTRRPADGEELTLSDNSHDEMQNRTPASYWITNPNNTFEDNIAAGTEGTGYWFIFPTTPLEPAASLPYYAGAKPSKEPLGKFDRNTAHSCMSGSDINDQLKSDHSIRKNAAWDHDGPFYFNDCAWFSNDLALYAGIGGRKQNVVYYNHSLADNVNSVVLATYNTVQESMLIADSGHGNLLGAAPYMYWIYDGAGQMVDNYMIGWDAGHANLFKPLGAATKHPNHRFSGFTWDHAGPPRNVHTRYDYTELPPAGALASTGHSSSNPIVWGQVVYDLDGSVAGLPGGALIANHPFMVTGSETMPENWAGNLISPNRFAHLRCEYSGDIPNVTVLRTKSGTKTEGFAYAAVYGARKHQLPLIVNHGFLYTYSYESLPSSREIQLNFDDTEVGDSVLLRFKDFGQLSGLSVTSDGDSDSHESLADLEASSITGYYKEFEGDLYIRPVSTERYNNLMTINWSGSLSMPMLDADLDGVDDMADLYNGTDPFGFAESTNDHSEFTQAADFNGWSASTDVNIFEVSDGALRGSIIGAAPKLSKTDFNFNGNSSLQVRVRYKNSNNGKVAFFWGTSVSSTFDSTRKLKAIYNGAGDWQELVFNLGREPEWLDHTITRLRIDPNGSSGDFEIDYIRGAGPGESDYSKWASGWYGGYLSDPWSDWNGNGLSNHAERLWGMDPFVAGRSSAIIEPLDAVDGVFTCTRRDVGLSGVSYSVWVSTDLIVWTEDTAAVQSQVSLNDEIETMRVVLGGDWMNNEALFIQVRAAE